MLYPVCTFTCTIVVILQIFVSLWIVTVHGCLVVGESVFHVQGGAFVSPPLPVSSYGCSLSVALGEVR